MRKKVTTTERSNGTGSDRLPDPVAILADPSATMTQKTAAQRAIDLSGGEGFDLMGILLPMLKKPEDAKGYFSVEVREDDEAGLIYAVSQKQPDGSQLPLGGTAELGGAWLVRINDKRLLFGVPVKGGGATFLGNAKTLWDAISHIIRNFALDSASDCTMSSTGAKTVEIPKGPIRDAVEAIRAGKFVIALTGAGISAESGVPTFRAGDDAIWNTVDALKFDITYFRKAPKGFWKNLKPFRESFAEIQPNTGHRALAEMEALGFLRMVITQNVDGLHQAAGAKKVIEVHGNLRNVVCLSCNLRFPVEGRSWGSVPLCPECGAVLKPDAVLFGEALPMKDFKKGLKAFQSCDVLLLVGTSGAIPPLNQAPQWAKDNGAKIIEINPERTPFTDTVTDIFLERKAGPTLYAIVEGLRIERKKRGRKE